MLSQLVIFNYQLIKPSGRPSGMQSQLNVIRLYIDTDCALTSEGEQHLDIIN